MSVVWTYTRLPWDCQADQWKQLWGTWKVNGEWWALKEWDIPEELGEEQHTLDGAENYHISCSAGLSQAVLGIDMCIPWNRCDRTSQASGALIALVLLCCREHHFAAGCDYLLSSMQMTNSLPGNITQILSSILSCRQILPLYAKT